ncbi:MAG: L-2-amino-thiazoline-4-carboxylic acid hydrolase [Gammaproteobacteria bacterium]|nr:L-2-amino-thiazoline-4-carboxylic acid hydrolase [Gammaproteobacteria bacterium]
MKYIGMPQGMWLIYKESFTKQLIKTIKLTKKEAKEVKRLAKVRYKEIINMIPEFEKEDMFKMNIVNCALFSAFYLNLKEKPSLDIMTDYYRESMGNWATKVFCKMAGKKKFSKSTYDKYEKTASFKAADRNPYSWNMELYSYGDGSGYEARFTKCGICHLMTELGIKDVIPAMCKLDYSMSEWSKASKFIREYTLASGGPYCDCGYKKL